MKVRFTSPASTDLEDILSYLAAHSPGGARRVGENISRALDLMAMHPLIGTQTENPRIRCQPVRRSLYLIFYEVGADEIIVHALRHGSRHPSTMPGSFFGS